MEKYKSKLLKLQVHLILLVWERLGTPGESKGKEKQEFWGQQLEVRQEWRLEKDRTWLRETWGKRPGAVHPRTWFSLVLKLQGDQTRGKLKRGFYIRGVEECRFGCSLLTRAGADRTSASTGSSFCSICMYFFFLWDRPGFSLLKFSYY